jgi:two-component system LytT family response regulator
MTAECIDGSRLISSIQENDPDLVILDANTPAIRQGGGWAALGTKAPPATIVTAYDSASLTAFTDIAMDLLVKPFDVERLETALDLARSSILSTRRQLTAMAPAVDQESTTQRLEFLQRLAVEADEKILLVRVDDIRWMQACGKYVRLHVGETSHLVRRSLRYLQALLDPNRFLRVHRNAIVNLDYVEEFHLPPTGNMFVKLTNGFSLPLRRANRSMLRRLLKGLS